MFKSRKSGSSDHGSTGENRPLSTRMRIWECSPRKTHRDLGSQRPLPRWEAGDLDLAQHNPQPFFLLLCGKECAPLYCSHIGVCRAVGACCAHAPACYPTCHFGPQAGLEGYCSKEFHVASSLRTCCPFLVCLLLTIPESGSSCLFHIFPDS